MKPIPKSALSLTVSAEGIDQLCAGLEPLNALQEVTDLSKVGSSKHSAGSDCRSDWNDCHHYGVRLFADIQCLFIFR